MADGVERAEHGASRISSQFYLNLWRKILESTVCFKVQIWVLNLVYIRVNIGSLSRSLKVCWTARWAWTLYLFFLNPYEKQCLECPCLLQDMRNGLCSLYGVYLSINNSQCITSNLLLSLNIWQLWWVLHHNNTLRDWSAAVFSDSFLVLALTVNSSLMLIDLLPP